MSAAVDPPTAPPAVRDVIRTCIGCRRRASAAELLRVVAVPVPESADAPFRWFVAVDPKRRAPGRGAWLHSEPGCVALAERRRAFGRALRVPGPVDSSDVAGYVSVTGR